MLAMTPWFNFSQPSPRNVPVGSFLTGCQRRYFRFLINLVGLVGFEPTISSSRTMRVTKLRYNPLFRKLFPVQSVNFFQLQHVRLGLDLDPEVFALCDDAFPHWILPRAHIPNELDVQVALINHLRRVRRVLERIQEPAR